MPQAEAKRRERENRLRPAEPGERESMYLSSQSISRSAIDFGPSGQVNRVAVAHSAEHGGKNVGSMDYRPEYRGRPPTRLDRRHRESHTVGRP